MSDIADILAGSEDVEKGEEHVDSGLPDAKLMGQLRLTHTTSTQKRKAQKPAGMSREVYSLISRDSIVPEIVSIPPNFKEKRMSGNQKKWAWEEFSNPARADKVKFKHWSKVGSDTAGYSFSQFNVALDPVRFTDDEYEKFLQDPEWTRSETDLLLRFCVRLDLRWPVIVDRFPSMPQRTMEEVQSRYFFVVSKLSANRPLSDNNRDSDFNKLAPRGGQMAGLYDAFYESTRRKLADAIFKRDLKESLEEESLRRQLAEADLEIKSLKKSIRNNPEINEFACRNDIERSLQFRYPVPGKPSLMSIRLVQAVPSEDAPSKALVKKICSFIREIGVPDKLVPSRRVCDSLDNLRRDSCVLITFQSLLQKKEKRLHAIKVKSNKTVDNGDAVSISMSTDSSKGLADVTEGKHDEFDNMTGQELKTKKERKLSDEDESGSMSFDTASEFVQIKEETPIKTGGRFQSRIQKGTHAQSISDVPSSSSSLPPLPPSSARKRSRRS